MKFRSSIVQGKRGTVYYQVRHRGEVKSIVLDIRILPSQWDNIDCSTGVAICRKRAADRFVYVPEDLELDALIKRINNGLQQLNAIIKNLETFDPDFSVYDIINNFQGFMSKGIYILDFFDEQIQLLRSSGKLGLLRNYQCVAHIFSLFLDGNDIPIGYINDNLICSFNKWLEERGVVRNSTSCYMRVLRSVYNKAVKQSGAMPAFPFANVYTGVDKTVKRAINNKLMRKLCRLDFTHSSKLGFARDLFLFSFCTRGMAFVDIAYLRMDNLNGNTLSYTRRKTGQRLNIFIEPFIWKIIKMYHKSDSLYVFPLINSYNYVEAFGQYQSAMSLYNKRLKVISSILGQGISLTSYTARHTWATSARNSNVPISVISAGMGHTSEQTTRIYLDSLENSVIDKANRGIIARLGI